MIQSSTKTKSKKKKKKKRHCGICCVLGCVFYLRYTWSEVIFAPKVFKMHSKGTERERTGKVTPFTMINSFQDVLFFRKILDLCTRPSREHHPWQFVLIYSRLKQDINKAVVLGSTCPHRAVCQSGRGNIWAPERCLIALAVCWRFIGWYSESWTPGENKSGKNKSARQRQREK